MRKLKLNKKTVVFIILAGGLLLELFLLPLAIRQIKGANRKISDLKIKLVNIEREWVNKDSYIKKNEECKRELLSWQEKFFLPQEEASVLSFVSSGSKEFNLKIEFLKPAKAKDYSSTKFGNFKYLPISIKAEGGYHDLARFMEYLQTSRYFFEIIELKIVSGKVLDSVEMVICGLIKEK